VQASLKVACEQAPLINLVHFFVRVPAWLQPAGNPFTLQALKGVVAQVSTHATSLFLKSIFTKKSRF
jgi:hypothetical protein